MYNKLGGFFGIAKDDKEADSEGKERACIIRMHVECVSKDKTGRAHFVRRATMKDGDKILFRAWEKEAVAQLQEVFNVALGDPTPVGTTPPEDQEVAALLPKLGTYSNSADEVAAGC